MVGGRTVKIDALPESACRYSGYDAIVCVDVLLSATTIVTAVAQGRRVFSSSNSAEGLEVKARHADALLVTDDLGRSDGPLQYAGPAWVTADGAARPLVHISPLAEMLASAVPSATIYVACLRNLAATAEEVSRRHFQVAILAAGEGGEVCTEDQMAAAWLARRLQKEGFGLEGHTTRSEVARWGQPDVSLVGWSRSAERLRANGCGEDVDFVLDHVDDLDVVCAYAQGELKAALRPAPQLRAAGGADPNHPEVVS
jgi:phosphosulfolactate phosphohydrolase-like enzyme